MMMVFKLNKGVLSDGAINNETLDKIINTLGVLPNPKDSVNTLLFVEGNHDINALKEYSFHSEPT